MGTGRLLGNLIWMDEGNLGHESNGSKNEMCICAAKKTA